MAKYIGAMLITLFLVKSILAQPPKTMNSAELLNDIQKLQVNASVLYIAAHPDDENTRLLAYLANERKYRTGYLSLTRGDGGQNLIGNEQGVELGLIRTQELLAARRVDGAEQFFSSAYDFGYSKTSAETFTIWDKQQILSDVVWVIRKFKPDVIITRFPEDERAGHGHHAGSAILAREAFDAAADPTKFVAQFKKGVQPWQAKRIIWNTFNFGTTNTTNDNQLKIDVGAYNSLLGKSYGEIAALSRSQHRSQGFGVPSQRGSQLEYFTLIAGDSMVTDIMDGVNTSIIRYATNEKTKYILGDISNKTIDLISHYNYTNPEKNVPELLQLYKKINEQPYTPNKDYVTNKLRLIIASALGLYMEATTTNAYVAQGDSLKINIAINARLMDSVALKNVFYKNNKLDVATTLQKNKNYIATKKLLLANDEPITQPYWLVNPMEKGRFAISEQTLIGNADVAYETLQFVYELGSELLIYNVPLQYKHTDPVKGELFEPTYIVPSIDVQVMPKVIVQTPTKNTAYEVQITPKRNFTLGEFIGLGNTRIDTVYRDFYTKDSLQKGLTKSFTVGNHTYKNSGGINEINYTVSNAKQNVYANKHIRTIQYDHIPTINYLQPATVKFVNDNIIASNSTIGYINGAGDKVAEALLQLGYNVDFITEKDCKLNNLKKYKAIITGVRAYNTNEWMNAVYDSLMQYVNNGGNLIIQYNTSNQLGNIKTKIAPFPFTISRNRITDEHATVTVINEAEKVLNYPNKITPKDFENWVQERSIYEATEVAPQYRKVLSMNDANEKPTDGSLIIAQYGKGNIAYCSLVLFRQLPAGIAGAYKLMANLIEMKSTLK